MMQRRAFTLLELLLVVVIIGVIYGLVINSMQKINDKESALGFESLPSFVQTFHQRNHVALICTDNCKACALYVDGEKVKDDIDPFMEKERVLRFWSYNTNTGTQELRFTPIFDEDDREFDVCFKYEIFEDGSSSEMIIETQKHSYDYRGLLKPPARYSSLQALEESRQEEIQELLQ
ncbi:prepilin-type N-terminal cleavage/methylation domain-containing protein [Sulfurimonas sp. HSL3-7]|uniref:prepilin-type N-terminal cleavage/methylation domain-containing protein n=1 Tax=Sulfonitrofixus jiaomeiensis TaxID=3131938 RepID=UPI0031F73AA3